MSASASGPVPLPTPATRRGQVVPECHGEVCITCSDEAVAVRVTELRDGDLALVDTGESLEEVSVAFVDAVVGDTVLVHAKEAIARVDAAWSDAASSDVASSDVLSPDDEDDARRGVGGRP